MSGGPRHGPAPAPPVAVPLVDAPQLRRGGDGYWRVSWTDAAGERRQRSFGKARAAARRRYEAWLTEWAADTQARRQQLDRPITVAEAWERYQEHALVYYRRQDGTQTGEARRIGYAMRPLVALYGSEPAAAMTVGKLMRARDRMVEAGNSLSTVNQRIGAVRRVWRWFELQELVPPPVWQSLLALQRLKAGRTAARSPEPVMPAPETAVEAACARLVPSVRAMVRLQLLSGMRPGEVCALTPAQVERGVSLWVFAPRLHKTAHHGIGRRVRLGPRAQAELAPYMDGPQEAPAFSPGIAAAERSCTNVNYIRTFGASALRVGMSAEDIGQAWTVDGYRQAIARACDAAGVRRWRPNQLRHTFATRMRAHAGLDAAQVALGHSSAAITEIYALADDRKLQPFLEAMG